jgi:hypothetical protein
MSMQQSKAEEADAGLNEGLERARRRREVEGKK